jgi:hypothetical protein
MLEGGEMFGCLTLMIEDDNGPGLSLETVNSNESDNYVPTLATDCVPAKKKIPRVIVAVA